MIAKRLRVTIYAASALAAAGLMTFGQPWMSKIIEGNNYSKISVTTLRRNYDNLPVHPGDERVGVISSFDKESITGVVGHLKSHSSLQELLDFYKGRLSQDDWALNLERRLDGKGKLSFCKNGMSLAIETSSVNNENIYYYYGIVWTNSPGNTSYCEVSKNSK